MKNVDVVVYITQTKDHLIKKKIIDFNSKYFVLLQNKGWGMELTSMIKSMHYDEKIMKYKETCRTQVY